MKFNIGGGEGGYIGPTATVDPEIVKIIEDASKRIKQLEEENNSLKQAIEDMKKRERKLLNIIGHSNLDSNKVKEYLLRD